MSAGATPGLPTAEDSERQVLGALLLGELAADTVAAIFDRVEAADFDAGRHRVIFDAIADMRRRSEPIDVTLAAAELDRRGELNGKRTGGPLYLADLARDVAVPSNAPRHAELVAEAARRRRVMRAAQDVIEAASAGSDWRQPAARLVEVNAATASGPRTITGLDWIDDAPAGIPSVWGSGDAVAWASGEPLLIVGPTGVGKTTLAQRLVRGLLGLDGGSVLGHEVPASDRPVLYVAADRPRQAQRSFRRMFAGAGDVQALDERLIVHRGPLPRTLTDDPAWLAGWAARLGAGSVVLDSLKDVATDIGKDEGGNRINLAFQHVVAEDIELAVLHHQRKSKQDGGKPRAIDDVYGSAFITAGAGSVVLLWAEPGDPVVELEHLKQPANAIGPMQVAIDHDTGAVAIVEGSDPLGILREARAGMPVAAMAQRLFGSAEPKQVEKARRRLAGLVGRGLAIERPGGPREPSRYYATTPARQPEIAMRNSNSERSR